MTPEQESKLAACQAVADAINGMKQYDPHLKILTICSDIPGIRAQDGVVVPDYVWIGIEPIEGLEVI